MHPIYLDYNATTPIDNRVAAAMNPFLYGYFGNPSSVHVFGRQAKLAVENSRQQMARLIGAHPDEIIFTSGGTESNNFAIKGVSFANRHKGNHIITSKVEHPAVLEVCKYLVNQGFRVTFLEVDEFGEVDPESVRRAITRETILISIMHANNEVGTIQPIEQIGKLAKEHRILFHTDAAQSVGKIPVNVSDLAVDLLSLAGHKLYAPKGVGALYIRRGLKLEKLIHGADHEQNLRAGTENVMQIVGLGMASEIAYEGLNIDSLLGLREMLFDGIRSSLPEIRLNGHPLNRLPNTLSLGFPGVEAPLFLNEMKDIAASAGAACHSDREEISGVLVAMNVPREIALGTIRFSLGRMTTTGEIEQAIRVVVETYRRLKGDKPKSIVVNPIDFNLQPETRNLKPGTIIRQEVSGIQHPVSGIRLTEYTHSLGCACKIRPQLLEKILNQIPGHNNPAILVGIETSDDSAVYALDDQTAIVQTVDFIPPVVDDPYAYGAIAAANAISDVYAMGGKPLFALSIVGFPDKKLPLSVLEFILQGANDKVTEAGIQIIGGHSIEDTEPRFGLVVCGIVHPQKILRNSTAKPGDALILTKPVGSGIITTAAKHGLADPEDLKEAVRIMSQLNRNAAEIMMDFNINACTDVTGFGLLGHLKEMVKGSVVKAEIHAQSVPVLKKSWAYAAAGMIPGGTKNNLDFVSDLVEFEDGVPHLMKFILSDAQTSGGLLISLPGENSSSLVSLLQKSGMAETAVIGHVFQGNPGILVMKE